MHPLERERMQLAGKTAIVTGAASGIGKATAKRFAEEGASVVLCDVNVEEGTMVADEIADDGDATFRELDVTDAAAFGDVVEGVEDEYDGVDILFNNAGITQDKNTIEDTPLSERDAVMNVNVNGVWNGCRAVLPGMKRRASGSIINTASMAGFLGIEDDASYCASKGGVLNLTRAVATEVGPRGVRVNAICPSFVDTPMIERSFNKHDDPESVREKVEEKHPIGRLARPEEVANCVTFLASEEASFVTGHSFVIDGGYTINV
jgi:NAD(P)-dependent dehydrogenase (short-subunit alcohol dehydrogenase family)